MLTGCATWNGPGGAGLTPNWVTGSSKKQGMVCAVGLSEPTFYVEDAKVYAAENARKELARSLQMDIKSLMIDVSKGDRNTVDEASVLQISSWATEVALRESSIAEYWYDSEGTASRGKKGITYALACMPFASALKQVTGSTKTEKADIDNK